MKKKIHRIHNREEQDHEIFEILNRQTTILEAHKKDRIDICQGKRKKRHHLTKKLHQSDNRWLRLANHAKRQKGADRKSLDTDLNSILLYLDNSHRQPTPDEHWKLMRCRVLEGEENSGTYQNFQNKGNLSCKLKN